MTMVEKIKNIIIIMLIAVIAFYSIALNKAKTEITDIELEKELLEKNLQSIVNVKNTEVKIVYKDRETIITKIEYLPPEGQIKISTDINNKQHIDLINKGFTFGPNIGISYAEKVSFMFGVRIYYWNRYGLGLGINSNGLSIYADRRIDDVFSFLPNSTIGVFLGRQELGIKLSAFL